MSTKSNPNYGASGILSISSNMIMETKQEDYKCLQVSGSVERQHRGTHPSDHEHDASVKMQYNEMAWVKHNGH